jgi:hypothetical protein
MTTINAVNNGLSGSTGTGSFVGSTSPAITTPSIVTAIQDVNTNNMLGLSPTTSAVNYFQMQNTATGTSPIFSAIGSDTNLTLKLNGKGTGGAAVQGKTSGSASTSGYVGELVSSIVAISGVSLTNNTTANITSISLTAGDWDVTGYVTFQPAGTTTVQSLIAGISLTSATTGSVVSPTLDSPTTRMVASWTTGNAQSVPTPKAIINVSSTTTVYLVALANFGVSTLTAGGVITARRVA